MAEVVEPDGGLNQALVEHSEWALARPPHVLPSLMRLEIPSSVKKIYPSFKGVMHNVECKLLKKQREKTETRRAKTGHNTHAANSTQALFSDIDLSILFACKGVTPGYSTYMGWRKLRSPGFWNTHSSQH